MKLIFGVKQQTVFKTDEEFFEFLGFICNAKHEVKIVLERNQDQGAWAEEYRFQFRNNDFQKLTSNLNYSAGIGNIVKRLNCNALAEELINNHKVVLGNNQNYASVKTTVIPSKYVPDFDRGFKL